MKKIVKTEKTIIYFVELLQGREAQRRIDTYHYDNLREVYEKIYQNLVGNGSTKKERWDKRLQRVTEISIIDGNIEQFKTVFFIEDGQDEAEIDLIRYKEYEENN